MQFSRQVLPLILALSSVLSSPLEIRDGTVEATQKTAVSTGNAQVSASVDAKISTGGNGVVASTPAVAPPTGTGMCYSPSNPAHVVPCSSDTSVVSPKKCTVCDSQGIAPHVLNFYSDISDVVLILAVTVDVSTTSSEIVCTSLGTLSDSMTTFMEYTNGVRAQKENVVVNVQVFEAVRVSVETSILSNIVRAPEHAQLCLKSYLQLSEQLRVHVTDHSLGCFHF